MNRRSFLGLIGAAPIAALAPWRPSLAAYHATLGPVVGVDVASGPDRTVVWIAQSWGEPIEGIPRVRIIGVYEGDGEAVRALQLGRELRLEAVPETALR